MAIKASGAFLKSTEIDTEFMLGNSASAYRGVSWYVDNALTTSTFSSTNLKFSEFYSKRKTDPAGAGSTTYAASGSFTVPLYRNSLIVDAWGGGAGSGGSNGGETSVTVSTGVLRAGGGRGGGGGGRRTTGAGGGGGSATGGDINQPGAAGGSGGSNAGGNAGGVAYGGGTGGAAPATANCGGNAGSPGNAPGGGGAGNHGVDCSKDPGWSYSGGGGGGGFVRKTLSAEQAPYQSVITFTVGAAGTGDANGAAGQVKMTWS